MAYPGLADLERERIIGRRRELLSLRVDPSTRELVLLVAEDASKLSSREFLIWAAAWIDTEGSIGYHRRGWGQYIASLSIANNDPRPSGMFKEEFGGTVFTRYTRSSFSKRPISGWIVHSRKAVSVLEKVVPFLIVKKERASLVIEHYKVYHSHPNGRGYKENVTVLHEALWKKMRGLNNPNRA